MSETVEQEQAMRVPTPAELGFDPTELRRKYVGEVLQYAG